MESIKFKTFFDKIKEKNNNNNNTFYNYIKTFINSWFIQLNNEDTEVLLELIYFLLNRICELFNINEKDKLFQFTKNNNQDLKALLLLLLPYLNDENTNIYNKIYNLNQILCYKNNLTNINKSILDVNRSDIINDYFKYSNYAVSLLNEYNDTLLDLYPNNEKLIWTMMHHNFMSILESLNQINGKMYINWLNITPIDNYKNSHIYQETIGTIDKTVNLIKNSESILDYKGLYIGEFYNIYRNVFYESIKKIKWLIFSFTYNNKKQYLIQYIDDFFNLDYIYDSHNEFTLEIKLKLSKSEFLQYEYDNWKSIIIFMVNNYSAKNTIPDNLKRPFNLNVEFDELTESNEDDYSDIINEKLKKISNEDIKIFLKNINDNLLINFFKESINELKSTIYSKYLFNEDNKLKKEFVYVNETNNLNLKNLYNISKSLSHNINNNFELYPTKYSSLSNEERIDFFNKFLNKDLNWINIKSNLVKENSKYLNNNEYLNQLNNINTDWEKIRIDLVFEYLSWSGILSEFKVDENFNFDMANNKIKLKESMEQKFKENKKWENTNYYLTNDKFSKLKYSEIDEKTNKDIKTISYFEYLSKKTSFYTFYAMDWMAQINFFNHYLNNRIMFITGSTGTGKSTQVPKLLLYSLKSLDYKQNGKIINTQPRISPTTSNAESISTQLGLQIEAPNPDFNNEKTKTTNFQVQFKHHKDNHIKQNCSHLTLKIATDGTLLEEILKNPLVKNQVFSKDKKSFIYDYKNKYDIIMIDESHEHNTNMDLLITLLRNSTYYNNDIKLVIVSATLEDDEPIYRSYFKYINDNLLYPIKAKTNHLLLDKPFLIDSVYLDRRFHISPPGKGTLYEIKEIYLPNSITIGNNEKINSKTTQEKSYEIIKKICLESSKGDILLFANGQNEITEAVKVLNDILPKNVIALPYFGKLNQKYQELIININKKINFIKTKREDVATTWNEEYVEDKTVQDYTYSRAVIIATNVAEASITIESLKYVVDNGYAKVNKYNEDINLEELTEEKISEASRKQRKGRVGRTSNGTVYYVYEKDGRKNIQPKFKITQENYEQHLISLINKKREINTISEYLISSDFDPNDYIEFIKIIKFLINDNEKIKIYKNQLSYKTNIFNIIFKQYKQNDLYYWNELYFNFMNKNNLSQFRCNLNGFELEKVLDAKCNFYIIHPNEDKIIRNILHNPIEINNKKCKKFDDKNFNKLISRLQDKLMLVNIEPSRNILKSFNISYSNYYITELVEYFKKISSSLNFIENYNDILLILYAHAFDSLYDVVLIFTLIKVCDNSIMNLLVNNKNFTFQDDQIEFLFNLIENIKKDFSYLTIFKNIDLKGLNQKYFLRYIELAKKFKDIKNKNKKNRDFSYKLYNKFNDIDENDELYTQSGFEKILNVESLVKQELYNEIMINTDKIKKWADQNNIDFSLLEIFLKNYTDNIIDILTINKENDSKYSEENPLDFIKKYQSYFLKTIRTTNKFEKIFKSFLYAYPSNIAINIDNNNIYTIKHLYKVVNIKTPQKNTAYCLFYFNIKELIINEFTIFKLKKKNIKPVSGLYEINITNKLDISWLFNTLPFFYKPSNFKTNFLVYNDDEKPEIISINNKNWTLICNQVKNSWSNTSIPFEDCNDLPILSTYIKKIKIQLIYEL